MHVILQLREQVGATLIEELGHATRTQLSSLSVITPNLVLFEVNVLSGKKDCAAALDRLRRDPRVLSVDPDTRRRPLPHIVMSDPRKQR